MELRFTKMHGCGNDYIYFNGFDLEIQSPETLSVRLSDRHTGVGGDGIVLILPPRGGAADARMRIFNADGSEAQMCGNGIRCVAKYLYDNGMVTKERMRIETLGGIREILVTTQGGRVSDARVDMGKAVLSPGLIPVNLPGDSVINRPVTIGGATYAITCVSTGNPHAVTFCEDVDALDLPCLGPQFESNALFPERINTEFVEVLGRNHLKMRVWERGSGETQACGTGACASAVAAVLNGHCDRGADVRVGLIGGELVVRYREDETVFMTGDCHKVFEGVMEYE
ncbi:MAG: diaminopimelate epimerase [Oscillospiraceae bacterium]|nr:diaminopimelate epimerase [Oscillospiraceae bacterium]